MMNKVEMINGAEMMNGNEVANVTEKRRRRTVQLTVALVLIAAAIFAMTFVKMPVWLPALL
jgi:hypothetical protein